MKGYGYIIYTAVVHDDDEVRVWTAVGSSRLFLLPAAAADRQSRKDDLNTKYVGVS